jgi:hypothetical protein
MHAVNVIALLPVINVCADQTANQSINNNVAKSYATRAAPNACHLSSESQLHKAGVIGVYLSGSLIGKLPVI